MAEVEEEVEEEEEEVKEVEEEEEEVEEEVVADFTLSPRGRASTPVDRFCNRQEDWYGEFEWGGASKFRGA